MTILLHFQKFSIFNVVSNKKMSLVKQDFQFREYMNSFVLRFSFCPWLCLPWPLLSLTLSLLVAGEWSGQVPLPLWWPVWLWWSHSTHSVWGGGSRGTVPLTECGELLCTLSWAKGEYALRLYICVYKLVMFCYEWKLAYNQLFCKLSVHSPWLVMFVVIRCHIVALILGVYTQ